MKSIILLKTAWLLSPGMATAAGPTKPMSSIATHIALGRNHGLLPAEGVSP